MRNVIKVENLSKAYQLGEIGTGSLSSDLERFWSRVRGKEDPFLKIGEINDRTKKSTNDVVWSLKDINFEVKQGDAVGIIGSNGAGKSTLLKILSRVTAPTAGKVKVKGRIASLLEVGTGFHPELSGKENIYLNGAILGMRRSEITRKFDEIVSFSGVERYIDTPVKRYSSGMYVRLAFAVAAHLESEIMIVDEVLAVGDAEFQKKCIGKMGDVSNNEGRTVLFVSHNMSAVKNLCKDGILLVNGQMHSTGAIETVCNQYLNFNKDLRSSFVSDGLNIIGDEYVELLQLNIIDTSLQPIDTIYVTTAFGFLIEYEIKDDLYRPDLSFLISAANEDKVFHSVHETGNYDVGIHKWIVWIPPNLLNNLEYMFMVGITTSNPVQIHLQHTIYFEVREDYDSPARNNNYKGQIHGLVRPQLNWQQIQ